MSESAHPHLLQHIVELTSLREQHALQQCLIKTLQEFISAHEISLYDISSFAENSVLKLMVAVIAADQGNESHKPKRHAAIRTADEDADIKQCFITKKQVLSTWENKVGSEVKLGVKITHPVVTRHGLVGFLVVKSDTLQQKDQDTIVSFLRIYHNYLELIDANERDTLTGLLNRSTFSAKMMRVLAAQRSQQNRAADKPSHSPKRCLAMLDIDHFKNVNDKFGHLHGDEVLLLFARLMTQTFRADDQLYRYGGEEFVVYLEDVDLNMGLAILERFRAKVEAFNMPQVGKVTVSIGAVEVNQQDLPTTLVEQADKALYYAKDNGRNQVCAYEKLLADGKLSNILTSGDIQLF